MSDPVTHHAGTTRTAPVAPPRAARPARRPLLRLRRRGDDARGQSLVEFSLVLTPLLFLLLGIVQFGFIFNTYVTLANATREAARIGTIHVYDRTVTRSANDTLRNNAIRTSLLASLNGLSKTSPQFTTGTSWTSVTSGTTTTFTNGDLVVTYTLPSGVTNSDPRPGWRVTVRASYHQDLVIPLIAALLPRDNGGRFVLVGEATMVIN